MLSVLNVTAPFFALVACGYFAARLKLLPVNAVPALNTFVLFFALPCMLFRFTLATPFALLFNEGVFAAYTVTGLLMLAVFSGAYRFATGHAWHEGAYAALASAWANWGYMGFALIPALFGPGALPVMIAAGMADLLIIVSAGLALGGLGGLGAGGGAAGVVGAAGAAGASGAAGAANFAAVTRGALTRVAKNPLMWGVLAGVAGSALSIRLPVALDTFVQLLGTAAGPVALFAIGVSLYRPGAKVLRGDVLMISGAKLLLHPYLVAMVALFMFGLPRADTNILILVAALPVAGTVFMFAERAGADAEVISASILVSTALAFFSFSALCWAFGIQLGR